MKKQHYMTRDERQQLEALLKAKIPVSQIARQLGFCRQTIYNEMERGAYIHTCDYWDEVRYSADKAQQIRTYRQTAKGRPLKIGRDRAYAEYLEKKMLGMQADGSVDRRKRYSPAAALAAARREGYGCTVSVNTLYSYITKRVFLRLTDKDLWMKGKKKRSGKRPERRVVHPALPSISVRPEPVNQHAERGHWEMDLIVGREGSRPVLLTMVERKTREPLAFKLPDKRAASVRKVFDRLEKSTPDFRDRFRSITTDNGSEFLEYEKLVQSIHGGKRFEVYYCHSYSAWEKGGVENLNRLFRRWFPKGTDFSRVPKREIAEFLDWAGHYPRKVLDWKCPAELAQHEFSGGVDAAVGNLCDITTPANPSGAAPSCCSC